MAIDSITKQIFVSDDNANLSSKTYYFDDNLKLFNGYSNITTF